MWLRAEQSELLRSWLNIRQRDKGPVTLTRDGEDFTFPHHCQAMEARTEPKDQMEIVDSDSVWIAVPRDRAPTQPERLDYIKCSTTEGQILRMERKGGAWLLEVGN